MQHFQLEEPIQHLHLDVKVFIHKNCHQIIPEFLIKALNLN